MRTIAMLMNNIVINIAIWDGVSQWNPGNQYTLIDVTHTIPQPGPGWTYNGTSFTPPASN